MESFQILKSYLIDFNTNMNIIKLKPTDLVFEERVYLKCFYCSKYDTKWTCPPRIPKIDYKKVVLEYENVAVVICRMSLSNKVYEEVRRKSTNEVHKSLLYLEKKLWDLDNPMCLTFIGGSCKLCKNGCAEDKCRNPGLKRIPIEATGINVIKSLKKINIDISFQRNDFICRFGLILW